MVRPVPIDQHRNFDDDQQDLPAEGPTFTLGGEEFRCVPLPAGGTLTRLAAAVSRDERGRQVYNLPDMNLFIEDCLIEEVTTVTSAVPARSEGDIEIPGVPEQVIVEDADDIERWRALMADKKRPIHVKQIAEVVMWLSETYNDRPTKPSRR